MLERTDIAVQSLRPASLLEALRARTRDLHTQAERSGIIADMLQGRATRAGYVMLLRNLLAVYLSLEDQLARRTASASVGPIVRPELARIAAIEADLPSPREVLPAALENVEIGIGGGVMERQAGLEVFDCRLRG